MLPELSCCVGAVSHSEPSVATRAAVDSKHRESKHEDNKVPRKVSATVRVPPLQSVTVRLLQGSAHSFAWGGNFESCVVQE